MLDPRYREYVPGIPVAPFDEAAQTLLDIIPSGQAVTTVFGRSDCPAGAALIEPMGCCWHFGRGPTKIIERLSLGRGNAWRIEWICEPAAGSVIHEARETPVSLPAGSAIFSPLARPWTVRYPDAGLTVFPLGFDTLLQGRAGTLAIPAGTLVGRLAYSPNGQRAFAPGNRTYAVANVLTGFEVMFACMREAPARQFGMPEFFLGDAPEKRMCHFLKHFGFDIIDNGDLGATVFAPVERVRATLEQNRPQWETLLARAGRQASHTPPPAP